MLTIYGVYRSRASRNIWLANELGLPFKHVPVIQHYRLPDAKAADAPLHSRSAAFLKVNPNGHIPSIDDGGLVLHESLAINLYLAKKHGGPLAAANLAEEGEMGMWSLWAATEVEPHSINVLYHRDRQSIGSRRNKGRRCRVEACGRLRRARRALAKDGHVMAAASPWPTSTWPRSLRYAQAAPELFEADPRVKAWLAACQARPAFRKMGDAQRSRRSASEDARGPSPGAKV